MSTILMRGMNGPKVLGSGFFGRALGDSFGTSKITQSNLPGTGQPRT